MKSIGVCFGITSIFMVLCGIAETLNVPIIYGIFPAILLLIGIVLCALEKRDV